MVVSVQCAGGVEEAIASEKEDKKIVFFFSSPLFFDRLEREGGESDQDSRERESQQKDYTFDQ